MSHSPVPLEQWTDALQRVIDALPAPATFRRVTVLAETDSTQDAAKRMHAQSGDIVVAGRQTSGRGRLGRTWVDTGEDGIAMTLVVNADRPERLSIAAAVATANGIESASGLATGLKWPNDVMINGRKVAGILVEQGDGRALIGIGINVHQTFWPPELADRAGSLRQLGVDVDRLDVMRAVIPAMNLILAMSDDTLAAEFRRRDVICGTTATFRCGDAVVRGTVLIVDPMRGLAVRDATGREMWLDASTTTFVKD